MALLAWFPGTGRAENDEGAEGEPMPSVSEQAPPDGQALSLELQAVLTEITRQVGALKGRAEAGDTRGVEEAKRALEELRDKLSVILPVEDVERPAPRAPAASENTLSAQIADMRSALTLYSVEHNGDFPKTLEAMVPKYLKQIPTPAVPNHKTPPAPRQLPKVGEVDVLDGEIHDTGAWIYVSDPASPLYGSLLIDCTHQNSSGQEWFKE